VHSLLHLLTAGFDAMDGSSTWQVSAMDILGPLREAALGCSCQKLGNGSKVRNRADSTLLTGQHGPFWGPHPSPRNAPPQFFDHCIDGILRRPEVARRAVA
jgi:hypothetical protein